MKPSLASNSWGNSPEERVGALVIAALAVLVLWRLGRWLFTGPRLPDPWDAQVAAELDNLCAERGIDTLIYAGVASNMCVCHRSFGIFNARRHGFRVFYTALGHWGDFELEPFRRLLRNAIAWALGR